MNHELVICVVKVVQTRLILAKDKVGLEAHYIMQKTAELVNFRAHNDIWA